MSYFFHPAPEAEYLSQIAYYEENRAGLGAYFISDFEETMKNIVTRPQMYKQVDGGLYR